MMSPPLKEHFTNWIAAPNVQRDYAQGSCIGKLQALGLLPSDYEYRDLMPGDLNFGEYHIHNDWSVPATALTNLSGHEARNGGNILVSGYLPQNTVIAIYGIDIGHAPTSHVTAWSFYRDIQWLFCIQRNVARKEGQTTTTLGSTCIGVWGPCDNLEIRVHAVLARAFIARILGVVARPIGYGWASKGALDGTAMTEEVLAAQDAMVAKTNEAEFLEL